LGAPDPDDLPPALLGGFEVSALPSTWTQKKRQNAATDDTSTQLSGLPWDIPTNVEVRTVDIWGNKSAPATITTTPKLLGANLVTNPGIEKAGTLGALDPAQWAVETTFNYAYRTSDEAFQGACSLALNTYDGVSAETVFAWHDYMYVNSGATYQLDFEWKHPERDPNDLKVYRVVQDEDTGDPVFYEIGSIVVFEEDLPWTHVTITGIPTTLDYLSRMSIGFGFSDNGAADTVYIDNVQLREELAVKGVPMALGTVPGEMWGPQTIARSMVDVTAYQKDEPVITARGVTGQAEPLFQGIDDAGSTNYKVVQDGSAYFAKFLEVGEMSPPGTPSAGKGRFYVKSADSKPHFISDGGTDYDLTDTTDPGAIPKSLVDAKGDVLTATADNTPSRLAVGTDGKVLTADSTKPTGLDWKTPTTGTVTSVGLTVPSDFAVSGSPVTGAGTLAVTENAQSANKVKAGPTTGSSGTPTYRSLVAADIPTLTLSKISDAGNSASRNVGTSAGTVAAGDDPRFAANAAASSFVGISKWGTD
jgi:hypothetical protein